MFEDILGENKKIEDDKLPDRENRRPACGYCVGYQSITSSKGRCTVHNIENGGKLFYQIACIDYKEIE